MKRIALVLIGGVLVPLFGAEQLRIAADTFYANEKKGRSVFEGHVRIQMGRDELNASRVEVFTDEKHRPVKYVAQGDASFYLMAEDKSTYSGRAQKAIFVPDQQEYRFYGDVHLMQINEHKQIDGEEVTVNIQKGTASARGAEKQPVIMTFELPEGEEK